MGLLLSNLQVYITGVKNVDLFWCFSSEGQTCEAPSSPWCFRRKADDSVYRCEWHSNTTDSRAKYDLFFEWVFQVLWSKCNLQGLIKCQSRLKADLFYPQVWRITVRQKEIYRHRQNFVWDHRREAHSVSKDWHLGGSSHRKHQLHVKQVVCCAQRHRYALLSVTHEHHLFATSPLKSPWMPGLI